MWLDFYKWFCISYRWARARPQEVRGQKEVPVGYYSILTSNLKRRLRRGKCPGELRPPTLSEVDDTVTVSALAELEGPLCRIFLAAAARALRRAFR
jgi:hypothetical protein